MLLLHSIKKKKRKKRKKVMNKAFTFYRDGVLHKKAVQTKTNSSILCFRNSAQDCCYNKTANFCL